MSPSKEALRSEEAIHTSQSLISLRSLLRILLLVFGLWIFYLSLHPFVPVDSWSLYWDRLMEGLGVLKPGRLSVHILAFVFLGGLMGLSTAAGQRILGFGIPLLLPDFCLTIELLQAATTTRHARLGDFLLNLCIAWLAHAVASRLFSQRNLLGPLVSRSRTLAKGSLAILFLLFLTSPFFRSLGASLRNWDESYHLLIGNELGGGRPWSGSVQQMALYPRALDAQQASRLALDEKLATRTDLDATILFDFRSENAELALRERGKGAGFAMLNSHKATVDPQGLHLQDRAWLESPQAPIPFIRAVRRSDAFSIELRFATASLHQTGPARILSLSQGISQRDFTLGQEGADLILRVRTPWNGEDGSLFVASWSRALIPMGLHHFLISYDHGRYRLFRDGEEWMPRQDLSGPGIGLAMLDLYQPLASLFLLLLPMGLLLAWLGSRTLAETRRRRETGLGLVLTAFYLVAGYLGGSSPDYLTLSFLLLGLPCGDLVGSWLIADPGLQDQDEVT